MTYSLYLQYLMTFSGELSFTVLTVDNIKVLYLLVQQVINLT